MQQILSLGLWESVRKLAKKASPRLAAVAYVSTSELVTFGEGDLLVVDASDAAIKSGATSADALKTLVRRGAEVVSVAGLHAKVLALGDTAVIGSANISQSSKDDLVEAAVITTSPSLVSGIKSLVFQLAESGTVVDQAFLSRISQLPVMRRCGHGFAVRYGPMPPVVMNGAATLLLTDVLTDDALPPALETLAPFDGFCWWCPGAYGFRAGLADEDKKRYRFQMRIALCHAAQHLLRSGGVFHVVDRSVASMPEDEHRQSLAEAYTAAAQGTLLKVTAVDFRPIETLTAPGGISMPHQHLPGGEAGNFTLVSVLLTKP